jgi:hypothetical protein
MPEADDKQKPAAPTARWVHTLRGMFPTETYGVVEFLRVHPWYRRVVATAGVFACVAAAASACGLKIPGLIFWYLPGFVIGPWLLYVATISGPQFEVVFPTRQAAAEREKAEKKFEQSQTLDDALKLDFTRLNEYYVINQNQARSSFRWAVFSMLLGFGTIIGGIWLFYFRGSQPNTFMASLSTAAGCVVNLVSALFLHLHSKTQDRSLHYYEQLSRLQQLSIAIRLTEAHKDLGAQQDARNLIIRELVSNLQPRPQGAIVALNKSVQPTPAGDDAGGRG